MVLAEGIALVWQVRLRQGLCPHSYACEERGGWSQQMFGSVGYVSLGFLHLKIISKCSMLFSA